MINLESHSDVVQLRERIDSSLSDRRKRGLLRELRAPGRGVCDFSSNDYLGVSRSKYFEEFFQRAVKSKKERPSPGATGSRLLSGHSELLADLELTAATFHRAEAALVFNSGYDANISILSCVPGPGDAIVYDELIHASVHDGMRMSRAKSKLFPFDHNNLKSLEIAVKKAAHSCSGSILICIETLYSMEGDIAPVRDILSLAESMERNLRRELHVLADEAHGGGVYGENGEGVVAELGIERHANLLLRVITFGKAYGAHGAVVLGSKALRQYLINYARPFIYSTALPPHSVMVLAAVYEFMKSAHMKAARRRLWDLVKYFHGVRSKLLPITAVINQDVISPIQAVLVPGNNECVQVSNKLRRKGFDVYPIRSPTVAKGKERIRIIIHAHNNSDEIRRMILAMAQALEELNMRSKL